MLVRSSTAFVLKDVNSREVHSVALTRSIGIKQELLVGCKNKQKFISESRKKQITNIRQKTFMIGRKATSSYFLITNLRTLSLHSMQREEPQVHRFELYLPSVRTQKWLQTRCLEQYLPCYINTRNGIYRQKVLTI